MSVTKRTPSNWFRTFYVYVDWTTEVVPRPFYVGKGDRRRVSFLKRNALHTKISSRFGLHRTIVAEYTNEDQAFDVERKLIKLYKTFVADGGANLDLGGLGGMRGTIQSAETRLRRSISLKKTLQAHPEIMTRRSLKNWSVDREVLLRKGRERYWANHPCVARDALIVSMLDEGLTPKQIAADLNIDLCNVVYRARIRHERRTCKGTHAI